MKMVSYAQNGEDVMLSRALAGVAHGFWIDAGAAGPTEHSVTRTFYDRGWTGVNVEPTERYFAELAAARPHDVNLRVALDDTRGETVFHVVEGTGLSTLDGAVAEGHKPGGWPTHRMVVPTRTLADVCAEFAPPTIHFLKVDVEGAEERVLRGADFVRFRPWIVLVEATRPLSPQPDFAGWEPILTAAGYRFVWFDGINRFYLADEKAAELGRHFVVPVNYFDMFDPWNPLAERLDGEAAQARSKADAMEAEARSQYTRAEAAERLNAGLRARTEGAEAEAAVHRSAATVATTAARGAEVLAEAADHAAAASRIRLDELRQFVADLQRQVDEARAREAAMRHDYETRLAHQHQQLHDRRVAQEHAETEAAGLRARLPATAGAAAAPEPAPPRAPGAKGLALAVYRAVFRPVVRPVMWRTRSFLVNALQHEQRLLHAHQVQAFHDLMARADRTEAAVHHLAAAPASRGGELAGLTAAVETALMTMAVTAGAHRDDR